ncbi:hypothetical protein GJAV_G00246290 [Gymnothorax javanicus]|nr:hypothetical protein GJAV_G00246290 [Gymnothorax javanicus]
MKPAVAACFILIILEMMAAGSTEKSSHNGESGELCSLLNKLLQVKDKTITKEMKILLKALFEAFSHCNLTETPATDVAPTSAATSPDQTPRTNKINHMTTAITTTSSITASTTPPPSTSKILPTSSKGTNSDFQQSASGLWPTPATNVAPTSAATSPAEKPQKDILQTPPSATESTTVTSITASSTLPSLDQTPRTNKINHMTTAITTTSSITASTTPPPSTSKILPTSSKGTNLDFQQSASGPASVSASSDTNKRKEETLGHSKSDLKFLWIILGVLSVLILGTILILKSKVLICTRIHTDADVADYMEEKMYSKNDDIILLGVTPGVEVEDECYLPRKG